MTQSKEELIILALQQRIGEMAAEHELKTAILRAEITQMVNEKAELEKARDEYAQTIQEKLETK